MRNNNYDMEDATGRIGTPTDNLTNAEYLIAGVTQEMGGEPEIMIYGNPDGLRHLAQLLLRVAEIDRTKDKITPKGSGYHCHIHTGLNTELCSSLPRITIGRVDSYEVPDRIREPLPALVPEFSKCSIVDPGDLPEL